MFDLFKLLRVSFGHLVFLTLNQTNERKVLDQLMETARSILHFWQFDEGGNQLTVWTLNLYV
jgi:hypothetical protein